MVETGDSAVFLCGDCVWPLFMELPQEDSRSSNPNLVARREDALGPGSHRDERTLGVYFQKEKDAEITLQVDDFLVVGEEEHLLELKAALNKVYKLKGKVLGPDEGDSKEGVDLWRRIRLCD